MNKVFIGVLMYEVTVLKKDCICALKYAIKVSKELWFDGKLSPLLSRHIFITVLLLCLQKVKTKDIFNNNIIHANVNIYQL